MAESNWYKKNFKKYKKGGLYKPKTITLDSGKKVGKFFEDDEIKLINALNLRIGGVDQ
tara:strand:- start:38 stop:211 length:174 start_codon:yes stop_codon:yes gene_type:complete